MSDMIFNLRIWGIHFQVNRDIKIKPMFAWYDFWIGLFFDTKKATTYIFPIPMFGVKIVGIRIVWNNRYQWRKDKFIWLFQFGKRYWPMREYDSWIDKNQYL